VAEAVSSAERVVCGAELSSPARLRIPFRASASLLANDAGGRRTVWIDPVSEVMEVSQIPAMLPYNDILQVGSRNMQNFDPCGNLARYAADFAERGIAATIEE